jgi:hypothetical protein
VFCDYVNVQMGINGSMRMYCVRHSRTRLRQLTAARPFSSRGAVRVCNAYTCSRVTLTSMASVQRDERLGHQHHYLPQTSSMAQRPTEEGLSTQIGETSAFQRHWASKGFAICKVGQTMELTIYKLLYPYCECELCVCHDQARIVNEGFDLFH